MKSALGLLLAASIASAVGCSTSEGKLAGGAGGTTATGGAGGNGGGTAAPITTPTELRDSGLGSVDAGETKPGEDSPLFGKLEPIPLDPNDPCSGAIIWQTAEPLQNIKPPMNAGAYVVQDNSTHLYQYVGKEEVDWPLPGCSPSEPTLGHCNGTQWWKDMGIECP